MKKGLLFLVMTIGLSLPVYAVFAQGVGLPNPLGTNSFIVLIDNVTNYITGIIGSIAVIVFIWAGILFVTSAGNQGRVDSARKAVFWAAVGLAIAIAGKGLISLVTYIITGQQ